ncbi:MAG: AAA family ATPase [Candidatus Sumerlaeota bacterium]|nr:AAA family ATPase [Candidatus Sumerlaeota bacterium]
MRLIRFEISNFKSLRNFKMDVAPCTALIGLNGSGKTTILQAIDFVCQLARPQGLGQWLETRGWELSEIRNRFSPPEPRSPQVVQTRLLIENHEEVYEWHGIFSLKAQRFAQERIIRCSDKKALLRVHSGSLSIGGDTRENDFIYQGSILGHYNFRKRAEYHELVAIRDFLQSTRSLELLSPLQMRKRVRGVATDIGLGGEKLSAFLHRQSPGKRDDLAERLHEFFPQIDSIITRALPGGAKMLALIESYKTPLLVDSKHASDGILRLLAIIAQASASPSCMLIDEIEDGFNQEIMRDLVHYLTVRCGTQIVMTTHSPLILNFMEDDDADVDLTEMSRQAAQREVAA